ncbi:MAG: hypothetical protein PHE27_04945 [Alphaproteobacteria bacterium]|nr:hypothetical protein [Alphaproteobacteria bacterium]
MAKQKPEIKIVSSSAEILSCGEDAAVIRDAGESKRDRLILTFRRSLFDKAGLNEDAGLRLLSDAHRNLYLGSMPMWTNAPENFLQIEVNRDCTDRAMPYGQRRHVHELSSEEMDAVAQRFAEETFRLLRLAAPGEVVSAEPAKPAGRMSFLKKLFR